MLAGHFGVGLALKAKYPSVPLGAILLASTFPDLLLALLLTTGWESLAAAPGTPLRPAAFASTPFSHDLFMVLIYACIAASLGLLLWSSRWALALGLALGSHVGLDLLVHGRDIGLGGPWLPFRAGLGLGESAPLAAWGLEFLTVLVGGALYWQAAVPKQPRRWRVWSVAALPAAFQLVALAFW